MSRRKELEKELRIAEDRVKNAPENTLPQILEDWRKEVDSIAFELDNLYDDDQDDNE